jgi:hypothetical protein
VFADQINCTHNGTGGTGTLTLAAVSGSPQPSSVFGTSGTRLIDYAINEYTDSTFTTLAKYERGIGSLVLSTGVLTRTPYATWDGTTYAITGATALSFGNTAANIRIVCAATTVTQRPAIPSVQSTIAGAGWTPFNTRQTADSGGATVAIAANTNYYVPVEFVYAKPITSVAIEVTTLAATTSARLALYDWGTDGLPQNLVTEFTSGTQFDCTTTGVKSVTGNWSFSPGVYWLLLQANGAPTLRTYTVHGNTLCGENGQRDMIYYTKGGTYGTIPTTGDKTAASSVTRSAGSPFAIWCK